MQNYIFFLKMSSNNIFFSSLKQLATETNLICAPNRYLGADF